MMCRSTSSSVTGSTPSGQRARTRRRWLIPSHPRPPLLRPITITRAEHRVLLVEPPSHWLHSPKCLETAFHEFRPLGILGSTHSPGPIPMGAGTHLIRRTGVGPPSSKYRAGVSHRTVAHSRSDRGDGLPEWGLLP